MSELTVNETRASPALLCNRYLESIRKMSSEGQEAAGIQGQEHEEGAQGRGIFSII